MTEGHFPRYRLLTGRDDEAFCRKVSDALELGYELHGSAGITVSGDTVYVAQAVVWGQGGRPPEQQTGS